MILPTAADDRRLSFRVHADLPWLVLAPGIAAELLLAPPRCQLPGARPWNNSAVNLRGVVYPVFDLVRFLGMTPEASRRPMMIGVGIRAAAIEVIGEPQVGRWQPEANEPDCPEALKPFVLAAGSIERESALLFDHGGWFHVAGGTPIHHAQNNSSALR